MSGCDDAKGPGFSVADLHYDLPGELIAQSPLVRRDDSRMLVVNRRRGSLQDSVVHDFAGMLDAGDLLVLNDTKVLPARFSAFRNSGGRVHGLFLEETQRSEWRVMLEGSRRLRVGETLQMGDSPNSVRIALLERCGEGNWRIQVHASESAEAVLERVGRTPLPPYIRRKESSTDCELGDRERYQTVYARNPGAVAAPTAGLHLSSEILDRVRTRGVSIAFVTLHVGAGTFKPIAVDQLADHVMHHERFEISEEAAADWKECRRRGGRVVAVGTTVVRVLETVLGSERKDAPRMESTNLFIHPPHRVTAVDALLTNFHLPRSTLLALVMAFSGVELVRRAYQHAIAARYRFYSYGDAMFIE
jgi:S-adenosylmethionine:tRNA ribosyltransferase-isomerase